MEIVSDGHNAHVVIVHAQGSQEILVGTVADLRIGDVGQDLLHPFFLVVHCHDLMVQLPQLHGNVLSKPAQADKHNGFHKHSFLLSNGNLLQRQLGEGVFICGQGSKDQGQPTHSAKEHQADQHQPGNRAQAGSDAQ